MEQITKIRERGKCHLLLTAVMLLLASAGCTPPPAGDSAGERAAARVVLQTSMGEIELQLDPDRAPLSAANFLRYADAGHYEGSRFHRTVRLDNQPDNEILIEVIQAGVSPNRMADDFEPIPLERTKRTGLKHTDGAVSMARDGPDTATSDFFICIGDQPELDFGGRRNPDGQGFSAFGRVIRGMEVVRAIQKAPASGQSLDPPILIHQALRLRETDPD